MTENQTEKKTGFFSRIANKMDKALKQKAEKKSQESGGCCGGNGKGGKCC
jgi:hypothetical protein